MLAQGMPGLEKSQSEDPSIRLSSSNGQNMTVSGSSYDENHLKQQMVINTVEPLSASNIAFNKATG